MSVRAGVVLLHGEIRVACARMQRADVLFDTQHTRDALRCRRGRDCYGVECVDEQICRKTVQQP